MVSINSAAEQKFLTEYISNASLSNNVWIGALRRVESNSEFDWNDGSAVRRYTNWGIGRPTSDIRRTCVLMQSELSRRIADMPWTDIACDGAGNWFICQKLQTWSSEQIQRAVLDGRRELQHNVFSFSNQMDEMKKQLQESQENLST